MAKKRRQRVRKIPRKKIRHKLAIERTEPLANFRDFNILLYGLPKIGKTNLASQWPNPVFIATEIDGCAGVSADIVKVYNWEDMNSAISLIRKEKDRFKTIVVDTADLGFKYCMAWCCETHGFDHPSEEGWGQGWEKIYDEFLKFNMELIWTGKTIIWVSHAKHVEVRGQYETRTRIEDTLVGTARRVLLPLCGIILYMYARYSRKKGSRKAIRTRAVRTAEMEDLEGGDRSGCLPDSVIVPEGRGYVSLVKAFNKGKEQKWQRLKQVQRRKQEA